ncbi:MULTISPECIES: hypothetical protein [unclassified Spirillospora]|uniref:hypothetical protein n=1 Tax=unclassified Spirillospora TaxID=2642701 RepID=UPI00371D1C3F
MIDEQETYVVPYTWRRPLTLALVALVLAALGTGALLAVFRDGTSARSSSHWSRQRSA